MIPGNTPADELWDDVVEALTADDVLGVHEEHADCVHRVVVQCPLCGGTGKEHDGEAWTGLPCSCGGTGEIDTGRCDLGIIGPEGVNGDSDWLLCEYVEAKANATFDERRNGW